MPNRLGTHISEASSMKHTKTIEKNNSNRPSATGFSFQENFQSSSCHWALLNIHPPPHLCLAKSKGNSGVMEDLPDILIAFWTLLTIST